MLFEEILAATTAETADADLRVRTLIALATVMSYAGDAEAAMALLEEARAIGAVTKLLVAVMMAQRSPAAWCVLTSAREAAVIIGAMRSRMNSPRQRSRSSGACAARGRSANARY